jgi:hypothetical protein
MERRSGGEMGEREERVERDAAERGADLGSQISDFR